MHFKIKFYLFIYFVLLIAVFMVNGGGSRVRLGGGTKVYTVSLNIQICNIKYAVPTVKYHVSLLKWQDIAY